MNTTYHQRKALRRLGRGQSITGSMLNDPVIRECYSTDHYPPRPDPRTMTEVEWCDYAAAVQSSRPRITEHGQELLDQINKTREASSTCG